MNGRMYLLAGAAVAAEIVGYLAWRRGRHRSDSDEHRGGQAASRTLGSPAGALTRGGRLATSGIGGNGGG